MYNETKFTLILLALFLLLVFVYPFAYRMSSETITIKVVETERIATGGDGKFLVYAETEVFENTDSWIFFKFHSADIQRDIEPKKRYKVSVAGWRVPFMSMYRNIIEVHNQ